MAAQIQRNSKTVSDQNRVWPPRWWILLTMAILGCQLAFIAFLSAKPGRHNIEAASQKPGIFLLTAIDNADPHLELLVMGDPANDALVHSNGFSGRLWFGLASVGQGQPPMPEPHRWLEQEQVHILLDGARPQAESAPLPPQISAMHSAPLQIGVTQTRPLLANSTLRLEGNLKWRQLPNAPSLPTFEFNDVLLPTSVQVVLDDKGHVISAILLSRSGLAAADDRALELARSLTFATSGDEIPGALEWGVVTFVWVTHEPAANPGTAPQSTNSLPPVS